MEAHDTAAKLVFDELRFRYGSEANAPLVLDGISGSVAPGELVSIIGPNGAGKSTLLRLCDGLEQPLSGTVQVNGTPLANLDHKERARTLAFVPQFLDRVPEMHVADFVLGGRYAHRAGWSHGPTDRAAVEHALASCDVTGLGARLVASLSGGQRQRVLIARALAQEAPVLLVDEPTNSLDPGHQLAVFELLASLAARGHSVLVVTHDLNLASQFSDRIALMNTGRIIASGPPGEVLTPDILSPIYGAGLVFGQLCSHSGKQRPYVLSWRSSST
jgi:iron complex transport system ATP-binding protein